jgi:uncharacterized protein
MAPRNRPKLLAWTLTTLLGALLLGCLAAYLVGTLASAPAQVAVGAPPADLPAEAVTLISASGSRLSGWFIPGRDHAGAVLLMHGIRANRLEMLGRARFLHRQGMAVLLFDFQAHGDSPGGNITFGYLEALDARAAFDLLRRRTPAERIGVIGLSLGGAAAILADLQPDAMVLEAVYASFGKAVENRLAIWLGPLGRYFAPLLTWQVGPRLGFDPKVLQPAERIARLHAPVLLIAGDADQHATLGEMELLYERAHEPKELWVIADARHVDFHRFVPEAYERKIVEFLGPRLTTSPK